MLFTDAADYTGSHEEEEHHMGRQVSFRLLTLTARRTWTALCIGVALFSLWLSAGCQPTAPRTSPTPPAVETPEPEPDSPPAVKPLPASAPTALSETELPPATGPYAGITETGEPPPDEYYGDPLFWIPGMEYETFYSAPDEPYSEPILFTTAERTRRIDARYGELLSVQSEELTPVEDSTLYNQATVDILTEGVSALDAAKVLAMKLGYNEARPFAQVALDTNPDDFHTLLLWTTLQFDPFPKSYLEEKAWRERAVAGYRRLLEMNPNSARVRYDLGNLLSDYQEFEESIRLLETAYQLDPRFSEGAFLRMARKYYFFGDKVKALAYLKRLAEVALTQRARETTRERIEALEHQGEWLLFVD